MTWFASLRVSASPMSPVHDVTIRDNARSTPANPLPEVPALEFARAIAGRDILFVAHGYNVSQSDGAAQLSALEAALRTGTGGGPALGSDMVFLGVLWPGDSRVKDVNYPFEGSTARDSGRKLAAFCNKTLRPARSLSFASHSLGARVILEAASALDRDPAMLCLTAAAVNADALSRGYADAARRAGRLYNLSSRGDNILKLVFPIGDLLGDFLGADDGSHFRPALGFSGARPAGTPQGLIDRRIPAGWGVPSASEYDHGNYLPDMTGRDHRWEKVAAFLAMAFLGRTPAWP